MPAAARIDKQSSEAAIAPTSAPTMADPKIEDLADRIRRTP